MLPVATSLPSTTIVLLDTIEKNMISARAHENTLDP